MTTSSRASKFVLFLLFTSTLFAAYTPVLPEAPRVYVDSTYPSQSGRTINVPAGGDLQGAIDQAAGGDVITLQAGATYTGSFVLRNKPTASFIVIRTSSPDGVLPNPGTRVQPSDISKMAKVMSPGDYPAFYTEDAAHHYRLVGLEITVSPTAWGAYNLILLNPSVNSLDRLPGDITVDRCYIHGNAGQQLRRGVAVNSYRTAIVDSYISEIHDLSEAQGIAGWNATGPFKIVNNFVEAAGENIFFNGFVSPNLLASDIEIRGNYLSKKKSWNVSDPSFVAPQWVVKNLLELKSARRVIIDGNILDNVWQAQQIGAAVLFTANSDSGPSARVEDIRFTNNIVRNARFGLVVSATNDGTPLGANRILVKSNVFEKFTAFNDGDAFWVLSGANDITFENNLGFEGRYPLYFEYGADPGLTFRNNIVNYNTYGIVGSGYGAGMGALTFYAAPVETIPDRVTKNVFMNNAPVAIDPNSYPPANYFPAPSAVGFTDLAGGNYRLTTSSPYKNAGVDGKDIGPDIDALAAATANTITGAITTPVAYDRVPPVISGITLTPGSATAAISWNTNEIADGQVEWGLTTTYGTNSPVSAGSLQQTLVISGLQASTTYQLRIRAKDPSGNLTVSLNQTFQTSAPTGAVTATYLTTDSTTQGRWKNVYGTEGYAIAGDATSYPAYAQVALVRQSFWTWSPSTLDARAPQKANASDRVAATWYSGSSFDIDVNITDGRQHQVSIYALDWDFYNRTQRIDILDAGSGTVLSSQAVSAFTGGKHLIWKISGHVIFRVVNNGGINGVVSGIFFDGVAPVNGGAATVAFVKSDTTTVGSWKGVYGADGYSVIGDATSYPAYASATLLGNYTYFWGYPSDVRALQRATAAGRIAATAYADNQFSVDMNLTDGAQHQVAFYFLDYDTFNRSQKVEVLDFSSGAVLDSRTLTSFNGGVYLVFNIKGHVIIRFTHLAGYNAVLSGIFFAPGTATPVTNSVVFVKTDTTTAGSWKGVYGAGGVSIYGDPGSAPAFAQIGVNGAFSYTWAASTADARALQKSGASDRIAATWYNDVLFTVDVNITDGKTHQLAIYAVDYDSINRAQTIDALDASTGAVLDTRSMTSYNGGKYLVWSVSGHIQLKLTRTAGYNAVMSGIFLEP